LQYVLSEVGTEFLNIIYINAWHQCAMFEAFIAIEYSKDCSGDNLWQYGTEGKESLQ
jgi:hypothetical protein